MRAAAAEAIAARPFPLAIRPGLVVSGFMPMRSEINPLPLMKALEDAGAQLALPVTGRRGEPLVMRAWTWGEPLTSGVWGIREPKPEAPQVEPEILLVPLLAFDRVGGRLGYRVTYHDPCHLGRFQGEYDAPRRILELLAEGLRVKEIAERLQLSPATVHTHVRNAIAKLEVDTRTEAVALAVKFSYLGAGGQA